VTQRFRPELFNGNLSLKKPVQHKSIQVDDLIQTLDEPERQENVPTPTDSAPPDQGNQEPEVTGLPISPMEDTPTKNPDGHATPNQSEISEQEIEITPENIRSLISDTSSNAIQDREDSEERTAKSEEGSTPAKYPLTIPATGHLVNNNNNNNNPECQLNVSGITTEFPMTSNSLEGPTTNQTLYEVHMELADFGFVMERGDITGATPISNQARSNSSTPIVVSYRNPEIKQRVVRAAQAANIWNLQLPTENAKRKGNICSFKEVAVRRHSTKQSGSNNRETTTPLTDGGQQLIQPINNLMETLKTIQ
jgi:hypothetical protein